MNDETQEETRIPHPRDGKDRRHLFPGRGRAIHARFTDDEYTAIVAAAHEVGLTPTGFCAQAANDAAHGHQTHTAVEQAELQALAQLQRELFRARIAVNQMHAELAGTLDVTNADSHIPTPLKDTIGQAVGSLTSLDDVISGIHRRLVQRLIP